MTFLGKNLVLVCRSPFLAFLYFFKVARIRKLALKDFTRRATQARSIIIEDGAVEIDDLEAEYKNELNLIRKDIKKKVSRDITNLVAKLRKL